MIVQKLRYSIYFLFLFSNIYAQNIFEFQNPFYSPESVNNIDFINRTGWAVGNYGLILKTTNYGQNFVRQSGPSIANFKKIFILDSLSCYILNDSSRLFKTTNGGNNWVFNSVFYTPVNDMHFINPNTGFIALNNSIGITSNSGLNWNFVSPDISSPYKFFDVCFVNSQTGFVSAINLTSNYTYLFKTTNSGMNWTWYNTTIDAFEINNFYFLNAQTGWCAGSRFENLYVMKTNNGGVNWIESAASFNSFLPNNLYFFDNNTGFITSSLKTIKSTNSGLNWFTLFTGTGIQSSYFINDSIFYLADSYSRIFKTSNAGNSFDTILGKQNYLLNRIQIINANTLWCNGLNSANWKSINGGLNWVFDYTSSSLNIRYTNFLDVNTGFAIANRGTIHKTTNFGINWSNSYTYTGEIYSLYFLNNQTGWAFADYNIYKTTNSGLNWTTLNNPNNIIKADFYDSQNGFGYNNSNLLKTYNGGINWTLISNDYINDYSFLDTQNGWIISNTDTISTIQHTTNSGLNWTQISVINENINYIKFINQSTGYLLSYKKIYRTTNGGYNWKFANIPTSLRIFAMDISDVNTGWLCGDNSLIMKILNANSIFVNTETEILTNFQLFQNYPNPFNSETNIKFKISKHTNTTLKIYDIQGREIMILINQDLTPNTYTVRFNSSTLSSGIYFYILKTGNKSITKKFVVLK